jgi:hypothetical protein
LANLRPEYHHVIFTPSDIITWFYKPKPSHDVETKPTMLETYFFGGSYSTSRHLRLERIVNLSGTRWITRNTHFHWNVYKESVKSKLYQSTKLYMKYFIKHIKMIISKQIHF